MANSENKTKPTDAGVYAFIDGIANATRRADTGLLLQIYHNVTGLQPVMWGPTIIGYGSYHYKYESGREGDAPRAGFSPRKAGLSLYMMSGYSHPETEAKWPSCVTGLANTKPAPVACISTRWRMLIWPFCAK